MKLVTIAPPIALDISVIGVTLTEERRWVAQVERRRMPVSGT